MKRFLVLIVLLASFFCIDNNHLISADDIGEYNQNYHLNSKSGFMNDIQSIFYDQNANEYRLYYLHNKDFKIGGNGTEWESVTTKDFINFTNSGTAIEKYKTSSGDIASGTVYKDTENDLGFGKNALISYVTSYGNEGQTQNIWYSLDNGKTYKSYENNPIMKPSSKEAHFRDPYVFKQNNMFYMYLAEGNKFGVYQSKDGKHFDYKSGIYDQVDHLGLLECPNLFEIKTTDTHEKKWVLLFGANGYERNETTGTYYVVGSIIDGVFKPETDARRVDDGSDFYGAKFMQTSDSQLLGLAWLGSWDYSKQIKSDTGNLGSMSMTRMLSLTSENNYKLKTSNFLTSNLFKNKLVNKTVSLKNSRKIVPNQEGYKTVYGQYMNTNSFAVTLNAKKSTEEFPTHIHVELENSDSYFKFDYDTTNGYYMVTRTSNNVSSDSDAKVHYEKSHVANVMSYDNLNVKLFVDNGSIEILFPETGETYSLAKFTQDQNSKLSIKMNGSTDIKYTINK